VSRPRQFKVTKTHELERIAELRFRHLMMKFFANDSSPDKMMQFIEMLAELFNLNQQRLSSTALETLYDTYPGIRGEIVIAMMHQKIPVNKICKRINLSPPTYYEILNSWAIGDFELFPKYNINQTREIIKLLAKLELLLDLTD